MADERAGAWWRWPLVLLIVASGGALAWLEARRRPEPAPPERTWSASTPMRGAFTGVPAKPATAAATRPAAAAPATPSAVTPTPATPATSAAATPAAAKPAATPATPTPQSGPFPGSVLPLEDGSAPSEEYVVKGNAGSMRSHSSSSPYFGRTRAQVWFRSQEDAAAAGFQPWVARK